MATDHRRTRETETQTKTTRLARAALAALMATAVAAADARAGTVITEFGPGAYPEAHAAVFWPRAKVVVAGHVSFPDRIGFALARYSTVDGSLDPTFGNDGKVTTPFSDTFAVVHALARRGSRIVAAGVAGSDGALAQYMEDGELDLSFGTFGKVKTNFGKDEEFTAVGIVQPIFQQTSIVAAGTTGTYATDSHDFAVAFYDANGVPLSQIGNGGRVTIPFFAGPKIPVAMDDHATALAVQPNGKVVVAGYATTGSGCTLDANFALARLNLDGTLDTTFGKAGKVLTNIGVLDLLTGVAIQADGKIVAAGTTRANCGANDAQLVLVRYLANGTIDGSFGVGGIATANFDPALTESATGLQIQADGKLVVVGRTSPVSGGVPNGFSAIVARFMPTGMPDPSFGVGGYTLGHAGDGDDYTYGEAVALDGAGGVLPVGTFLPSSGPGAGFLVGRLTSFGDADPAFGQ